MVLREWSFTAAHVATEAFVKNDLAPEKWNVNPERERAVQPKWALTGWRSAIFRSSKGIPSTPLPFSSSFTVKLAFSAISPWNEFYRGWLFARPKPNVVHQWIMKMNVLLFLLSLVLHRFPLEEWSRRPPPTILCRWKTNPCSLPLDLIVATVNIDRFKT